MTTRAAPILDSAFIRRRRLELGLTRAALQRATGISQRKAFLLERDQNNGGLRVDEIVHLAESLGVDPGDLFLNKATVRPPQPNDVRLEAAILLLRKWSRGSAIRNALDMTESQFREAANALSERLRLTGATLAFNGSGLCRITARVNVLNKDEIDAVERPNRARSDINVQQARVLKRVLDGQTDSQELTNRADAGTLMAISYLENNRMIRLTDGHYRPTAELRFSLGLSNTPPRRKRNTKPHER